ncbi:hypothetical protein LINPERHAP1_LOCUS4115 [Linum perenne]
MTVWESLNPD